MRLTVMSLSTTSRYSRPFAPSKAQMRAGDSLLGACLNSRVILSLRRVLPNFRSTVAQASFCCAEMMANERFVTFAQTCSGRCVRNPRVVSRTRRFDSAAKLSSTWRKYVEEVRGKDVVVSSHLSRASVRLPGKALEHQLGGEGLA